MRESRNNGAQDLNTITNGSTTYGAKTPEKTEKIELNQIGRQLFNMNAKNYIKEITKKHIPEASQQQVTTYDKQKVTTYNNQKAMRAL